MNAKEEHELRSQVADLVLEWYTSNRRSGLEDAAADDFPELIRVAQVVSEEAGHSLDRWVEAGRHAGLSWADVGLALGISRQAAQQRFSQPEGMLEAAANEEPLDLICRTGMTAFNEVAAMREEGDKGNELVGAAVLKLYFAPRGRPYDNIRVTALRRAGVIKRYEDAGWTHALTWYPFHYFTRPAKSGSG